MDRKLLESYPANKRLIERNLKKLEEEKLRDIPVIQGKVKGSSAEFPFTERRFSVEMDEPAEADKQGKRIKTLTAEIQKAEANIEEVDKFIFSIEDVRDREIFTYRFVDGLKLVEVAERVGYTHGRISQIIKKYLKD